ncbi:ABC-2 family transporter protein [compost metagenome]
MMGKVLKAEYFRLKKICLWIPIISAGILVLFSSMEWYFYFRKQHGDFAIFNAVYIFISINLLLCVSLLASIVAETEHQAQGWKLLFATSVSRVNLFLGKVIWVCLLMLVSCFLIIIGMILVWLCFTNEPFPLEFFLKQVLSCYIACLPVLAIQLVISIRSSNQAIPLGIGVVGAISSLFIPRISVNLVPFIPWAYPAIATPFSEDYLIWLGLSLVVGILLVCAGTISFAKMELK